MFSNRSFLWLVLSITFLGSAWLLSFRLEQEVQHQGVVVVVDEGSMEEWINQLKVPINTLREALKVSYGISRYALDELTVSELIDQGKAELWSYPELQATQENFPGIKVAELDQTALYFTVLDPNYHAVVASRLQAVFSPELFSGCYRKGDKSIWVFRGDSERLMALSVGFDYEKIAQIQAARCRLWLRVFHQPEYSPEYCQQVIDRTAKIRGVDGVIFGGPWNQVLGFGDPQAFKLVTEAFRKYGLMIGLIELAGPAQQPGITNLARLLPEQTARVFSLPSVYQAKLSPRELLHKYELAQTERNTSVHYVRPYLGSGSLDKNSYFFEGLAQISADTDSVPRFQEVIVPGRFFPELLVTCGTIWAWLLVWSFSGFPKLDRITQAALIFVYIGIFMTAKHYGLESLVGLYALSSGVAFSVLAIVWGSDAPELKKVRSLPWSDWILKGISYLFVTGAIAGVGGLALASYYLEPSAWLGVWRFRGIKALTLGAPLLTMLLVFVQGVGFENVSSRLRLMSRSRVYWFQLALLGIGVGALAYHVLRSGNAGSGSVSGLELKLRYFLDSALGVRPRFKEFLLAFPCAVLLPYVKNYYNQGARVFLAGVLALGSSGIADTFAHFHTPLAVSFIRSQYGVLLGGCFGVLALIILMLVRQQEKTRLGSSKQ